MAATQLSTSYRVLPINLIRRVDVRQEIVSKTSGMSNGSPAGKTSVTREVGTSLGRQFDHEWRIGGETAIVRKLLFCQHVTIQAVFEIRHRSDEIRHKDY